MSREFAAKMYEQLKLKNSFRLYCTKSEIFQIIEK